MEASLTSSRVREIRTQLGYTQQQFANALGVGKVTVARWETGQRACRGEYARRVRQTALGQFSPTARTSTIFDVDAADLRALDSGDAVEALRDLLWCESRRLGIPSSEVQIGTLEVADQGIDAVVPAMPRLVHSDSFLGDGANHFQIKAGPSWKPWQPSFAKKELLGNRKHLGDAVKRCLSREGRYVLASFGTDLTPDQRESARANIMSIFAECGFSRAKVDVWGVQELLSLFGRFPFLSLRLSGRDHFQFQSWSSWNLSSEMSTFLELGELQVRFRDEIRRLVCDKEVSHIRVIGEPGLGKTRLVHEALRSEDLAPQVVYIQHAEDFQKSQLFHDLLNPEADYFLILVLDECRPRECSEIWDRLSSHADRCKVITLDHDSFQPSDGRFVELECPRLDIEKLVKIIGSYVSGVSDATRWADLCSGVPRVAHAIGRNLQTNPNDLLKAPSMHVVWDRFISGYRSRESTEARQKLIVLRYIALFHRFGFESPVEAEGEFIAGLIHDDFADISYARFQEIVGELKRQRILQGKTTLFIAPKLLHVHLWTQFWELHGRRRSVGDLIKKIPESLTTWFVRMFPYAGESPVALQQVERVLGTDGPFGEREFAMSRIGCRFLHELANASPKHTLACLERILADATADELSRFDQGRQDVVWALERIAVWPSLFPRAARLLRTLAEFENASHSNNSTGVFTDLFCLAPGPIAPTGAPPETRLPILAETLGSAIHQTRQLGVKACGCAMSERSGIRVIGREHQGLKTLELWTPTTWGEVHSAMGQVWDLLAERSRHWSGEERREANDALIDSAAGLLQIQSLAKRVLDTLDGLASDDATDLQHLVQLISRIRRFWKDDYDDEVVKRLIAIDSRITGASFEDRLRRTVHLSVWDDFYGTEDGRDEKHFNHRVAQLALEASEPCGEFRSVLPGLVAGTNNGVFEFGREFARHDNGRQLNHTIDAYRAAPKSASALFISGYLATLFDDDPSRWESIILDLVEDDTFDRLIGVIIRNSGGSDEVILRLLRRYDAGALDIANLQAFAYAPCLKRLSEPVFLGVLDRLIGAGDLDLTIQLLDYVYCEKECPRRLPEVFALRVLSAFSRSESRAPGVDYHWRVVAEQFIEQFPSRRTELFELALNKVAGRDWFLDSHSQSYGVIEAIIRADPDRCWRILASRINAAESSQRYRLLHWLGPGMSFGSEAAPGPLTLFPIKAVFDWVAEDPEKRAYELASVVPKSLAHDNTGAWARELLNRYGDKDDVKRRLVSHFWAGSWSGRGSDRYRRLRDASRNWLEKETSWRVRQWLEEFIDCLSRDIERSEIEEEREV